MVSIHERPEAAPAPLIAIALGIAASGLFGLQSLGVETVGHIPQGLPPFTAPSLGLIEQLWPGALGIALMSFTESIAAARAFAGRGEPSPAPNRELLATGLGNVAAGLFSGMHRPAPPGPARAGQGLDHEVLRVPPRPLAPQGAE